MASSYADDWEEEYTGCERCGDDHGDGLTCREVERVEEEMREEEEEEMERDAAEWDMEWDGPRHRRPAAIRRRAREVTRVRLVRVGDRVYYAEDTVKIAAYRLVWAEKQIRKGALERRDAALRLWQKVWRLPLSGEPEPEPEPAPAPAPVRAAPAPSAADKAYIDEVVARYRARRAAAATAVPAPAAFPHGPMPSRMNAMTWN